MPPYQLLERNSLYLLRFQAKVIDYQYDLWLHEQLEFLVCWNFGGHGEFCYRTNLDELELHLVFGQMRRVEFLESHLDAFNRLLSFVLFYKVERKQAHDHLPHSLLRLLDLEEQGRQQENKRMLQHDPTHIVLEIQLSIAQLHELLVLLQNLHCKSQLEHQVEIGRIYAPFRVFLLG